MKINGSALIVEADTEEEVRKCLERDIYYTAGVWDAKKVRRWQCAWGDVC